MAGDCVISRVKVPSNSNDEDDMAALLPRQAGLRGSGAPAPSGSSCNTCDSEEVNAIQVQAGSQPYGLWQAGRYGVFLYAL